MKRVLLIIVFAAALSVSGFGQDETKPGFSSYPAKVETKRARSIDFGNSPGARKFRTRLREAFQGDVNFAGRYIIASWGCGSGCLSGAVIDTRNGRVYFPKELSAMAVSFADTGYDEILTFHRDSRLLVIAGILGTEPEPDEVLAEGAHYFEWVNNKFRLVKYVPAKR